MEVEKNGVVVCGQCSTTESLVWQRFSDLNKDSNNKNNSSNKNNNNNSGQKGQMLLCGGCYKKRLNPSESKEDKSKLKTVDKKVVVVKGRVEAGRRRLVRHAPLKQLPAKGKSRRHVLKKRPPRKMLLPATSTTSDFTFHKGSYWQKGDIVSVRDEGGLYYAQVIGILTSPSLSKQASVRWLVPVEGAEMGCFEATSTTSFINVDHIDLVCHSNLTTHPTPTHNSHHSNHTTIQNSTENISNTNHDSTITHPTFTTKKNSTSVSHNFNHSTNNPTTFHPQKYIYIPLAGSTHFSQPPPHKNHFILSNLD